MLNVAPNKKKALYSFTTNIMLLKTQLLIILHPLQTYNLLLFQQNIIKIDIVAADVLPSMYLNL